MPVAAALTAEEFAPRLTPFEASFIRTVLEHRGVCMRPTLYEFSAALDVLRRYDQQLQDNPPDGQGWEPAMEIQDAGSLRAMAFMMFGATKPSAAQWHKAHVALFGPLLCETCG